MYEDDEYDGAEADDEENGRPSFSSIAKSAGFLDRELAASGFTRKTQDDIEKVCINVVVDFLLHLLYINKNLAACS